MAKENNTSRGEMKIAFIICDNTINRYGWRLLVEGIDITGFKSNPVCCLQHDTWLPAIGKWTNLRVEDSQLKGTVEFDGEDPDAAKLFKKYKNGYMNAVSLNIIPLQESSLQTDLLPGQKYPTITKSELIEVSLVTIPGQKNAVRDVKLSNPDKTEYKLNFIQMDNQTEKDKELLKMKEELLAQKQLNAANLIKIHEQRGVVATAEKEPLMKLALSDYDNTSKMLEARETPKQQPAKPDNIKLLAESLVTLHFERGAITAEQKGVYLKAAELDYEGTKKTLEGLRGKEIVNAMNFGSKPDEKKERVGWTYLDYYKKAPEALIAMEKDEPERYKKLCSDFEEESKKNNLNLD